MTREELQKRLWPDTFVDVDHSLNTAINKIREVLGDSAESPRFVETLPRRGYRFVGSVIGTGQAPGAEAKPSGRPRRGFRVASLGALAVIAMVIVLLGLNVGGWRGRIFDRHVNPPVQALAVLPLENLSRDPEQEYFADGITVALIADLGRVSGPRVISRQSVMQYKGTKKSLQEIAKELNVDAVLEGTVERSGDRVRVTVRLDQVSPETQLWANKYDRSLRDVLALEDEIARSVSSEISVKLTPEERRSLTRQPTVDAEAHSEYLQGLYYGSKGGANVVAAVTHFKNSIQRDPTFAPAYAELAIKYLDLRDSGGPPAKEVVPLAKAAAAKALELDPSLPQAHQALGLLAEGDYDWSEAEAQFRAALTLNPNCDECHHLYGVFLEAMGRNEEAVVQIKRAIELDPLSPGNRNQLAMISFTARQFDLAISQFESLGEDAWWAPLALSYAERNRFDEALAAAKNCEIRWGSDFCIVVQSRVYSLWGRTRDARKAIDRLKEISRHRYVYPTFFSGAYLAAGDKEQALTWMERAYDEKDPGLFWLKVWPLTISCARNRAFRLFYGSSIFPGNCRRDIKGSHAGMSVDKSPFHSPPLPWRLVGNSE